MGGGGGGATWKRKGGTITKTHEKVLEEGTSS